METREDGTYRSGPSGSHEFHQLGRLLLQFADRKIILLLNHLPTIYSLGILLRASVSRHACLKTKSKSHLLQLLCLPLTIPGHLFPIGNFTTEASGGRFMVLALADGARVVSVGPTAALDNILLVKKESEYANKTRHETRAF